MLYRAPSWATPALLSALRSSGVKQARFHKDGTWYHRLREFPGALCDPQGFIVFMTEAAFLNYDGLVLKQDVHVQGDRTIGSLPGYVVASAQNPSTN
jgi:hypothetical protein